MFKTYFENKNCTICKKQAIKYRYIGGKGYYLCDNNLCDLITLVKAGWKTLAEVNLEEK